MPKILVLRMTCVEELLLLSADAEGSVELSARKESGVPHVQREKSRSNIKKASSAGMKLSYRPLLLPYLSTHGFKPESLPKYRNKKH